MPSRVRRYPICALNRRSGARSTAATTRATEDPGEWWILVEPELHFVRDIEVVVPDIAGWRRERMPSLPDGHRIEVVPDWVCEVLSPSTESKDREIKMPIYTHYGRCNKLRSRTLTIFLHCGLQYQH
jgi:hypothetical protein